MTITTDMLLCAALDAGDALAVQALADEMEDRGDRLAAGMRAAAAYRPEGVMSPDRVTWSWAPGRGEPGTPRLDISGEAWDRLALLGRHHLTGVVSFPCPSAAYLALAEALSPPHA